MHELGRWYRAAGTGLCFAAFGLGCVLVGTTVLPALLLWPADRASRRRRVRRLVSWAFRALLSLITSLGLGRVEVEGQQWLAKAGGRLVLATHPNYLDVVVLLSLLPTADCVVKSSLWRNPFTRAFVKAADYISNDDGADLIEACIAAVRGGQPLVLFPEGTRSVPGEPLRLKRGAMQVAVRGGFEILPVVMHCSPPTLLKHSSWWQVPERPWVLKVRVCPPRRLTEFAVLDSPVPAVAVRRSTRALQSFFQEQISDYEHA